MTSEGPKPHRLILPLGMRVLVQIIRDEERTDAGLYLPAGAKEAQDDALYGKVIEVARDRPTTDEATENVLIDVNDVLATVEEVHAEEAH